MADIYYWAGGTAGDGVKRFDFNCPSNWRLAPYGSGIPYNSVESIVSTVAPGAEDMCYFGFAGFTAYSPCLYGGFSGNRGSGEWLNSGDGNGNWANTSVIAGLHTTTYPFPYFGGGITGQIYDYCVNVLGLDASELTGLTGLRADQGLKLRVRQLRIRTTGRVNHNYEIGGLDANGYPNYSVVNINCVSGTGLGQRGEMLFNDGPGYCINPDYGMTGSWQSTFGYEYDNSYIGYGDITINGGVWDRIDNSLGFWWITNILGDTPYAVKETARSFNMTLSGMTVGTLETTYGNLYIDSNCTVGELKLSGALPPRTEEEIKSDTVNGIRVACKFDTNGVEAALGLSFGSTASPYVSGIFTYEACKVPTNYYRVPGTAGTWFPGTFTSLEGNPAFDYTPVIYIGEPSPGVTVTAQNMEIKSTSEYHPLSTHRPWRIEFAGDTNITNSIIRKTKIQASDVMLPENSITLKKLTLDNRSCLDLASNPNINNWFFGAISGSGQSANIIGGINFTDNQSYIQGDLGIRLAATKMTSSGLNLTTNEQLPADTALIDFDPPSRR